MRNSFVAWVATNAACWLTLDMVVLLRRALRAALACTDVNAVFAPATGQTIPANTPAVVVQSQ